MNKYLRVEEALLQEDNPFSLSVVGDAWETCLDVESINQALNDKIKSALARVHHGQKSRMYLIQGEQGMGKTHFLSRIRTKYAANRAYFIQIRPLPSIVAPYQFFLHEISTSLRKKPANHMKSPFLTAFGTIITDLLNQLPEDYLDNRHLVGLKADILAQPEEFMAWQLIKGKRSQRRYQRLIERVVNWITLNLPDVDLQFVRALFQVFNPTTRNLALLWLQGDELLPEQLSLLTVSKNITLDDMALRVIKSLFILLPRPIVLSVDQLESIADALGEKGLRVLFEILTRIHDLSPNVVILMMCQTQLWQDVIAPLLKESSKARIDEILTLNKPTTEEALDIITLRLEQVWKQVKAPLPYQTFPFTPEALQELIEQCGWNPRRILKKLGGVIREFKQYGNVSVIKSFTAPEEATASSSPTGDSLEEAIEAAYQRLNRKIIQEYPKMGLKEKQDFLIGNLIELFRTMEHFPVGGLGVTELIPKKTSSRQRIQLRLKVTHGTRQRPVVLEVNNNKSPNSALATLRRLVKAAQTQQIPLFIRDSVLSISKTATKTQEMLQELKTLGQAWFISDDEFISLQTARNFLLAVQDRGFSYRDELVGKPRIQQYLAERIYSNISILPYLQQQLGATTSTPLAGSTSTATKAAAGQEKPSEISPRDVFTPTKIIEELEKVPVLSCNALVDTLQVSKQEVLQTFQELAAKGEVAVINDDQANLLIARKPHL